MSYKSNFLIIALLFCTTIARAQYNQVNDIPYREAAEDYAQERCKLDVYYPTNAQDAPVVVWFHGGGIEGGEKHIDPQLKNSGLVVVAANYRLLPKAPRTSRSTMAAVVRYSWPATQRVAICSTS